MKRLGVYPIHQGDNVGKGVITRPREFVKLNTLELFREMLPNHFEKGIRIDFHPNPNKIGLHDPHICSFVGTGKNMSDICRDILIREPADVVKKMEAYPLLTLWWICYRVVRGYMVESRALKREQMLPFVLYERFGFSPVGQRVCDDFTAIGYPAEKLQLHIDCNLVSNVIVNKLSKAWMAGEDPCPLIDLGPLLLVTKQDYRKLC
jgi:hypothetical protein